MKTKIVAILWALGLSVAPYVAANEVNLPLAQCQELQGEATRSLMKSCAAHIGCEIVLKRKNSCADAAKFIGKLQTSMVGAKKITNEVVFEAALPAMTSSDAMEKKIAAVRQTWRAKKLGQQQGIRNFVDETGKLKPYYYEGGLKDGKPHGIGIKISPTGYFRQGEFVNDALSGQGWAYRDFDVVMFVGDFVDNNPNGNVAYQGGDGSVQVGNYSRKIGTWQGVVNVVKKNGTYSKVVYDDHGKNIGEYPGSVLDADALRLANSQQKKKAEADAVGARYDQRISAARDDCRSDQSSCKTGCSTEALIQAIGKTGDIAAHLECERNCERDHDRCQEQANALEREKRQAVAAALAPPSQASSTAPSASAGAGGSTSTGASANAGAGKSAATGSGLHSSRVCDGQCAMIVAETKCKHVRDNVESLQCQMSHGMTNPDTPALCAEAKALTGCRTKAEAAEERKAVFSKTPSSFETVCDRNMAKIEKVMQESGINFAPNWYDLASHDYYRDIAHIHKPCIGTSATAARSYKQATEEFETSKRFCAERQGSSGRKCTRWGAHECKDVVSGAMITCNNEEYYRRVRSEIDKALSNPDYSAELGPIGRTGPVDKAAAACHVALDGLVAQHKAAEPQIPKDSVVVRSEAMMWLLAKSAEVIKAKCPESKSYQAQLVRDQRAYSELQRVCDATASAPPCRPRLPGKEPVAPMPVASKPMPPVSSKPEGACGRPPSASALKCLEERCAKEGGKLEPANRGCYVCIDYGNKWFTCPDGRDAVQ